MDFVDSTWLPGGKLSQVSICRHSRKRLGVSLHFERLGGRSCGCYSIDSMNSIQSGCNYQYATATHLSITSLLTHSTRCFCAFGRQLPQIEIYSASSRTVDSQFTRCLAQSLLHLANYWTPPTIFASWQVDHMRGGFNQFGEVGIFENWEVERGCKLNSRLVVSLKG